MGNGRHVFDWDNANTKKCQKHGVSIAETESLFMLDPAVYPDPKHSKSETRYLAIGRGSSGRYLFAVFTYRMNKEGENMIRPISVRYMHQKEITHHLSYEKKQ